MARGTFANIRLLNKFLNKQAPQTIHLPSGEVVSVVTSAGPGCLGVYPVGHFPSLLAPSLPLLPLVSCGLILLRAPAFGLTKSAFLD